MDRLGRAVCLHFPKQNGQCCQVIPHGFWRSFDQKEYGYSDEDGSSNPREPLPAVLRWYGYQEDKPFDVSTMVHFRKRLTAEMLNEVNEIILDFHEEEKRNKMTTTQMMTAFLNKGTLMLDATCAPSYIKYPQDIGLLNDARLHAQTIGPK